MLACQQVTVQQQNHQSEHIQADTGSGNHRSSPSTCKPDWHQATQRFLRIYIFVTSRETRMKIERAKSFLHFLDVPSSEASGVRAALPLVDSTDVLEPFMSSLTRRGKPLVWTLIFNFDDDSSIKRIWYTEKKASKTFWIALFWMTCLI